MAAVVQNVTVPETLKITEQKPKYKVGKFFKLLILN